MNPTPPSPDAITIERHGEITLIVGTSALETIDPNLIEQAAHILLESVRLQDNPLLVIDLEQVDYFGSSFLALLLRCWKLVKVRGGLMVLAGVVWVQTQRPDLATESVSGGEIAGPGRGPRWLVDGMNVIGSRPDGWWRDRPAAMRRLVAQLGELAAATGDELSVVFDGRPPADPPAADGVEVEFAPGGRNSADDRIAQRVGADGDPSSLRVVTSDRELSDRVAAAGAEVVGAGSFRRRLDELGG